MFVWLLAQNIFVGHNLGEDNLVRICFAGDILGGHTDNSRLYLPNTT